MSEIKITSVFANNERIPEKYTCDGLNINPPLTIEQIPKGTKSLVLIMDDPDAPSGTWNHWIVWNIKPGNIKENSIPGVEGLNSWNRKYYGGPCPPRGTHRYFFKIYAIDTILTLPENINKHDLLNAVQQHFLSKAELIGVYSRS